MDATGAAYVTGWTYSSDFPTTSGAFDTFAGSITDAFVTKLSADGSSLAYRYVSRREQYELGRPIAVDATGAAYVTGYTFSGDFPTTSGAFGTLFAGATTPS